MTVDRNENRKGARTVVTHGTGVYDVTSFADIHPGGRAYFDRFNKKDITNVMDGKTHQHGPYAMRWMAQYRVGYAKDYPKLETPELNLPNNDGFVDWSKPMFWQVGALKEKYNDWLEIPTDRPLRLFKHDFAEYFSNTNWFIIPLIWLPVSCYLALRCHSGGVSLPATSILMLLGVFWWTLTEYVLHRFVFHLEPYRNKNSYLSWLTDNSMYITAHFLLHGQHHKVPFDKGRLVFPPVPAAALVLLFRASFQFFCGNSIGDGLISGGLFGYVCYDMIHYFTHHGNIPKGSWLDHVRRYHIGHHFNDPDSAYGISSQLWDIPFRTSPKAKTR